MLAKVLAKPAAYFLVAFIATFVAIDIALFMLGLGGILYHNTRGFTPDILKTIDEAGKQISNAAKDLLDAINNAAKSFLDLLRGEKNG